MRLIIENLRCFEAVELDLSAPITVLIGDNGAGKTSLVEALASLCFGEGEGLTKFPLRHGAERGVVALLEGQDTQALWVSDGERMRLPEDVWLFAYGRYRRVVMPKAALPTLGDMPILPPEFEETAYLEDWRADPEHAVRRRRTTSLTSPDHRLLEDLDRYLRSARAGAAVDATLAKAWAGFCAVLAELRQALSFQSDKDAPLLRRGQTPLELAELSDGYQSVLVVLFDLVLRYTFLFPELDEPLRADALVLIDEVDLHLHPRWQRQVVPQLARLFPNTRFVITTHSAAVVQGAIDGGHRVISLTERGGRVLLEPLDQPKSLEGAEISTILVDDRLFDTASRLSVRFEQVEDEVRALRAELEAGGGAEVRAALLEQLERLAVLAAQEDKRRADGRLMTEIVETQMRFLRLLEAQLQEAQRPEDEA